MKKIFFFLLLLAVVIQPCMALNMNVQGNLANNPVVVTPDKNAFVIFRMNNGTPIYAYGMKAKFIPHVTGNLYIEARADGEVVSKRIRITESSGGGSGGEGGPSNIYWEGTVCLPSGSFIKTATNGKVYTIKWRTALGALEKASRQGRFSYTIKETDWGPFVDCIAGKCSGSEGATSGWMYQVNGETPMVGASECDVNIGDVVTWYFSRSMSETPESSPMILNIHVRYASTGATGGSASVPTPLTNVTGRESLTVDISEKIENGIVQEPVNISAWNVTVEIPEGTEVRLGNKTVTEITIKPTRVPKAPLYAWIVGEVYDFKPDGATFDPPINLSMRYPASVTDNLAIACYCNGTWVELNSTINPESHTVTAEVSHFTEFAVIERWRGFPLNVTDEPIVKALKYLKTLQNDDGGFANPGEESSIAKTSWAIMALVAAKQDPHRWVKNGNSPVDYLKNNLNLSVGKMGTADFARTILALTSANENPGNFSGINLVEMLKSKIRDDGQIGDFIYTTIWGILALKACNEDVNKSVEWLKKHQNEDGGFAWAVGEKSDYDDTAAAIQALISAEPRDSEVIKKALEYLKTGQNDDGGFRYFGSSASNAASDAWVIQALVAAGENPVEWRKNNVSVVDHLLSLQTEEGSFNYTSIQTSNPGYMTVCAIMALTGSYHPIKAKSFSTLIKSDNHTVPTETITPVQAKMMREEHTPVPFEETGKIKVTSEVISDAAIPDSETNGGTTYIILLTVLVLFAISTAIYVRKRR